MDTATPAPSAAADDPAGYPCDAELSCLEGGGALARFEEAFANLVGAPQALGLSSGTAALHTALLACDIGPGDEVIVSAYGWGQTVAAVLATGATPVFADIDPDTGNLDPAAAAAAVGPDTRAVLVTHLFGRSADMAALRNLCERHALALLADGAQALGALHRGRPIAAWADITCFSLGRGKALSVGEGGMAVSADPLLHQRMTLVSQHPVRALRELEDPGLRRAVTELGLSYRLARPACELGLARLPGVESWIRRRRAQAARATERLAGLAGIIVPHEPPGERHVYHALVLRAVPIEGGGDPRTGLIAGLEGLGIAAWPGPVRTPLHLRTPFSAEAGGPWYPRGLRPRRRHPSWCPGSCPRAERRCRVEELRVHLDDGTAA